MKIHKPRSVTSKRRRRSPKKAGPVSPAGQFLRSAFYYLKAEQYLKTSMRLLCDAI